MDWVRSSTDSIRSREIIPCSRECSPNRSGSVLTSCHYLVMAVGGSQLTATTRHTLIILLAHDPAVETSLIETGEARWKARITHNSKQKSFDRPQYWIRTWHISYKKHVSLPLLKFAQSCVLGGPSFVLARQLHHCGMPWHMLSPFLQVLRPWSWHNWVFWVSYRRRRRMPDVSYLQWRLVWKNWLWGPAPMQRELHTHEWM